MYKAVIFAGVAASCLAAPLAAEDLGVTAAVFGARESVTDIAISPSGNMLLYVSPGQTSDETVYVVDLVGDPEPRAIVTSNEPTGRLAGCNWANDERIICNVYAFYKIGGSVLSANRLLSISADGRDVQRLYELDDGDQSGGRVLSLDVAGETNRILVQRSYNDGLGVASVNIRNGNSTIYERPNGIAVNYLADETGRVRIMASRTRDATGYTQSTVRYLYRTQDSNEWHPLSTIESSVSEYSGYYPVAVDGAKNLVYGFEPVNGHQALVTIALDGSSARNVVLARDDVDVDGLERIGRQRRVVGVSYATDRRFVEYFDPELAALAGSLERALPGTQQISIVDASADENELVLIASSDTDPGTIYLYERNSRQLSELLPMRDPLVGREMGEMRPITYAAADGTQIPGYLTLPPGSDGRGLPAIVIPHGGPGSRDEWGFDWLVQFFVARGYAVLQPNFRGSAGYGEAWFGSNGFQAWETAIGDVNDAGRWLVSQGIADPARMGIAGWSYGGYAALQSQVLDPALYKAVVAIAPVTDLNLMREESRRFTDYRLTRELVGEGPHIQAGSPARHADRFAAPVLLVHGTMDMNVGVSHSELMEDRLKAAGKSVDYLEFEGLDHGLVHSQARGIMLRRIGAFLDANLGG